MHLEPLPKQMSRYYRGYRRRSNSGSYWACQNVSERSQLSIVAGGIDKDIEKIFLNLPAHKLEAVLIRYGREHGNSALSYARNTYYSWNSGKVTMSGKVAERLLNLVPAVLDSDTRFDLVKKLREAHQAKINKTVRCEPHEWRTKVAPEVSELLASSSRFQLPASAVSRIRWLADGDSQAAQQLLAAAEEEEAIARIRHLELEFRRIDTLIQSIKGKKTIIHTIQLPQGVIHVTIGEPQKSGCFAMVCLIALPFLIPILLLLRP
jgi:hypothetical protein